MVVGAGTCTLRVSGHSSGVVILKSDLVLRKVSCVVCDYTPATPHTLTHQPTLPHHTMHSLANALMQSHTLTYSHVPIETHPHAGRYTHQRTYPSPV